MKNIILFMKRHYKIISLLVIAGITMLSFYHLRSSSERDKEILKTLRMLLLQGHYQPVELDDTFSARLWKDFLDELDPAKHYFIQSDIEEFSRYKTRLDDEIMMGNLFFFDQVYERFLTRIKETESLNDELLSQKLNISTPDSLNTDYEHKDFPKDLAERKERWIKELKMRYLSHLYNAEEEDEEKAKDDSTYVALPEDELRDKAFEDTRKEMENLFDRIDEQTRDDWLSYYFNSFATEFGPHTIYMPPKVKKRFDISMSGKLEGIGARLQKEGAYTKVVSLISGGPAWRGGELEAGDIILKVAQGDELPVDIVGMRLDDAIELIKGKKGTEVRLTLKKVDGSIKTISIIRDVVELEETFVKSSVIQTGYYKFGLINLPQFYIDFNEKNYRNSYTDMKLEVERLKSEGVGGLVIDLRNNGGGSLKTAVEIAGMFIDEGPVVQVRYRGEKVSIHEDEESGYMWNGPLVILVNEFSASASEIFTAAMQDYHRAIIIGSKQTFGKGTVQNIIPLDRYSYGGVDMGFLKLTIQKFYRINGGSTQLKGVVPDIVLPDRYAYMDVGERDEKYPMEWDKIEPAKYTPLKSLDNIKTSLLYNSKKRIDDKDYFQLIDEQARWLKKMNEEEYVYLDYDHYKRSLEEKEEMNKKFDELEEYDNELEIKSPQYEISLIEKDSILKDKRENWHKNLRKDPYLEEAIHVLEDWSKKGQVVGEK